jgi:hypothetical protein
LYFSSSRHFIECCRATAKCSNSANFRALFPEPGAYSNGCQFDTAGQSGFSLDAATISDTVNTASRLESLSKYFGVHILLSKNSLDNIPGPTAYHARYLGQVQVKGKQKPVDVFECFDGDPPADLEHKLVTLADFESGMQHYFGRQFARAIIAFEAVLKQNPADASARLFLNKAAHYIRHGVPEEWMGVEMMEGK